MDIMWTWILLVALCVQYSMVEGQGEVGVISQVEPKEEETEPLTQETIKKLNTPIKIPEDLVEIEDVRPGDDKDDDGEDGGGQDGEGEHGGGQDGGGEKGGVEDGGGQKGGGEDGGGQEGGGTDDGGEDGGGGGDGDGKINKDEKKKTKIHEDKNNSDQSPDIGDGKGGLYTKDMLAGDIGDLAGANKHRYVPRIYADFARRAGNIKRDDDLDKAAEEKLHQSIQIAQQEINAQDDKLRPVKADPKLVMDIALQSARLEAAKPINPSEAVVSANIMRSGNYWNSVWKEDVPQPSRLLRSHKKRLRKPSSKLESVRVKIMPGSKLYELVALTKQISPKLLYIINKK